MRRAALFGLLAIGLAPQAAHAAGINLSWDECGVAGASSKEFACDVNVGAPFVMVASFDPPAGVTQLVGVSGEIRVAATSLPDWWRHGTGRCRGPSALTTSFDFRTRTSCTDPWSGRASGGLSYVIEYYGPNTARLQVSGYMPDVNAVAVTPGTEYYAFEVRVARTKSTGFDRCAGCDRATSLTLNQVHLYQRVSAGFDPIITTPASRNVVAWQALPGPPPQIQSFSPGGGRTGDPVTILGSHFTAARLVRFDAAPAAFAVISDTEIHATVPSAARTGAISVTTPNGSGSSADNFEVQSALRYFVPRQAPAGHWIAIVGDNLASVDQVTIGGLIADRGFRSDTLIQARIPLEATTGPVVITSGTHQDTSDSALVVGPWLEGALDFSWDDCGAGGNDLKTFACNTNTGSFPMIGSFVPPPDVIRLDGFAAVVRIAGDPLPNWWLHASGYCRGSYSIAPSFDFRSGPFTCTDLWKGSRHGSLSYEIGYFGPNTARMRVTAFGPELATSPDSEYYAFRVTVDAQHTIGSGSCSGCTVPVSFTLDQIELFQDIDLWFNPPAITMPLRRNTIYWQGVAGPLPVVRDFQPRSGGQGTPVRIAGLHFTDAWSVRFGEIEGTFSVESDSVIQAVVPPDARSAPISVSTLHGTGVSTVSFLAPPVITAFTPSTLVGQQVAIVGYNLSGTNRVEFNGVQASFTPVSDTFVRATVPAGATTGRIVLFTPAGSDTSSTDFVVAPPPVEGINFAWDDCGAAGSALKTWTCDSNVGAPFTLVASFKPPPGIGQFLGIAAQMNLLSTNTSGSLPDWWQHGTGYCRGPSALSTSFDFRTGPSTCFDVFQGNAAGGFLYQVGGLLGLSGPNRAALLVQLALPLGSEVPLIAGTEYYGFKVLIQRTKTTGSGSCSGCTVPGCITLSQLQLFQPDELNFSPKISIPLTGTTAFWQAPEAGCVAATPVQISLVISEAHADHNRIVWELPRGDAATVYRREGEAAWQRMDRLTPDGEQRIEYVDGDVRPGVTYRYRLGFLIGDEEIFGGETALTVPVPARTLALSRIGWSGHGVTAMVILPTDDPATLEVFDLSGRRAASKRLEGLGVGEKRVDVATRLKPGVYFGRLTQDRNTASGRFVVVQ